MSKSKRIKVGEFNIKSGKVFVSDPCYSRGTWCMGELDNVQNGKWQAEVIAVDEGMCGTRNGALIASYGNRQISKSCPNWKKQNFEVGVDSGQAGIFDDAGFKSEDDDYGNTNSWYRRCCDLTSNKKCAGIIEKSGVVSSSGFGDGSYDCYVIKKGKKIVAIKIDFCLDAENS